MILKEEEIADFSAAGFTPQGRFTAKKKPRPRKFLSCCGCFLLAIFFVALLGYLTVVFFVGPIMHKVSSLPGDLPADFTIYKLSEAKIQVQDAVSQEKLYNLAQFMPNWLLQPLWDRLAGRLNINQDFQLPNNFSADDVKTAIANVDLNKLKTVSLSWDKLDKTKEELSDYYKNQLANSGFQLKESITDYDINLTFWKENVFGIIDLGSASLASSSAKMLINYLRP